LYETGTLGGAPHFDGSDAWPVLSTSLVDGADLGRPVVMFPDGYIAQGTWVSGSASARFEIPWHWAVDVFGCGEPAYALALPVDAGFVALRLADGTAMLAGAIDVRAIPAALTPTLETLNICPGDPMSDDVSA